MVETEEQFKIYSQKHTHIIGYKIIQVGRVLRRSSVQPLAQSRVSYKARPGWSGFNLLIRLFIRFPDLRKKWWFANAEKYGLHTHLFVNFFHSLPVSCWGDIEAPPLACRHRNNLNSELLKIFSVSTIMLGKQVGAFISYGIFKRF